MLLLPSMSAFARRHGRASVLTADPGHHDKSSPSAAGPKSARALSTKQQSLFDDWMDAQRSPAPVCCAHNRNSFEGRLHQEGLLMEPTPFTSIKQPSPRSIHNHHTPRDAAPAVADPTSPLLTAKQPHVRHHNELSPQGERMSHPACKASSTQEVVFHQG